MKHLQNELMNSPLTACHVKIICLPIVFSISYVSVALKGRMQRQCGSPRVMMAAWI